MPTSNKFRKRANKIINLIDTFLNPKEKNGAADNPGASASQKRYENEKNKFIAMGGKITHQWPILSDYEEQAGTASGHYFHQDLLVASMVYQNNPKRHIDIGSRIDGFVAHVAAFRKIEVLDFRDLQDTGHINISFIKSDLMEAPNKRLAIADSISCLHALEHFGLGRYGDPLDPCGHLKGFRNMAKMVDIGGTLYVSIPIGKENEVHFNAHRVFHPADILTWLGSDDPRLSLIRFDYVDDLGKIHQDVNLQENQPDVTYGCGIYTFRRM